MSKKNRRRTGPPQAGENVTSAEGEGLDESDELEEGDDELDDEAENPEPEPEPDPGAEHWAEFNRQRVERNIETRIRGLYIIGRSGRASELAEGIAEIFDELHSYLTAHELAVLHRIAELAGVPLEFSPEQLEAIEPLKPEYVKAIC